MEINGNNFKQKISKNFCCEYCNYITDRKNNMTVHLTSSKHSKEINGNDFKQVLSNSYNCVICNKIYKTHAGLWKHKKGCNAIIINNTETNNTTKETAFDKELIIMLIKQNSELVKETSDLKNIMMKVIENGTNNVINSNNKSFNLNLFLNETCKDAMNIMDFAETIQLQLNDLVKVGELGYVDGISDIIVKNLKALDVTQRPVHCTDKKRETIYIKDENKWEKDAEQKKMHKFVKKVASKNQRLLPKFKEVHPDCVKSSSQYSDQYNKLIIEAMGGRGDNDYEKEEKIIKNISKAVIVEKDPV